MSWKISKQGSKDDVLKYLQSDAPNDIKDLTGEEQTIAQQLLTAAAAVVQANQKPDIYDVDVEIAGNAIPDETAQDAQVINLTVNVIQK